MPTLSVRYVSRDGNPSTRPGLRRVFNTTDTSSRITAYRFFGKPGSCQAANHVDGWMVTIPRIWRPEKNVYGLETRDVIIVRGILIIDN